MANKTSMVEPTAANPVTGSAPAQNNLGSNIPQVESHPSNLPKVDVGGFPADDKFSGTYVKISDGETYALAVVENDPLSRSHKAKNSLHSWEGTKEEFRAQFDVKDGDKRAPKE